MTNQRLSKEVERRRHRAVRNLFLRIAVHIAWWDVVLARGPLRRFRTPLVPRWTALANEFRAEAEQLGGVLIKLGQFVSSRVDLLPSEVTDVLAELNDAVPPVSGDAVVAQIESDFARPLNDLFVRFDRVPVGAASLAQAHRARLTTGEPVVVKVLRPGIEAVIASDLKEVGRFVKRLKDLKTVRRRVDVDILVQEFVTVTRLELDLEAEAVNSSRFAEDFGDDPAIGTPRLYPDWSGRRTLTMEDVSWYPVQDVAAYEAVGIDRRRVATKLMDCYLEQLYVKHFVHCDPHPGNLFIRPLPAPGETDDAWAPALTEKGELPLRYVEGRPFQIVFIDFGMSVAIPHKYRQSFRTYAIGMGTRDAYTVVQSYVEANILEPDADTAELERLIAALLNKFPGAFIGQVRERDIHQYEKLFNEYQDLLYNSPLKLQADLLFVFRAMGVCAGTVSRIDSTFDPAERFAPMVRRLLAQEWQPSPEQLKRFALFIARLPARADDILTQLERGKMTVRVSDAGRRNEINSLTRATNRLSAAVLFAGGVVGAVLLSQTGIGASGYVLLAAALLLAGAIIHGIR